MGNTYNYVMSTRKNIEIHATDLVFIT